MQQEIIDMYKRGFPIDFIVAIIYRRLKGKYARYFDVDLFITGEITRSKVKNEVIRIIYDLGR